MDRSSVLANRFFEKLLTGKIKKYILPNTAVNYSIRAEAEDLFLYKKFINSSAYDDIRECEVGNYDGDNEFIL